MLVLTEGDLVETNKDYYGILHNGFEFKEKIGLIVRVNKNFYPVSRVRISGDQYIVMWSNGIGKHPVGSLKHAGT
jgi:hypothetical protein